MFRVGFDNLFSIHFKATSLEYESQLDERGHTKEISAELELEGFIIDFKMKSKKLTCWNTGTWQNAMRQQLPVVQKFKFHF